MLAAAQRPTRAQSADDAVRFKITSGGRDLYKLAIPLPLGDKANATTAETVLSNDLALSGFFKVLDPASYLANLTAEQLTINPPDWRNVGAEGVVKARATAYGSDVKLEFRLFEVAKGDAPVLSKDYRGPMAQARQLVHQFANDVVKYYTGEDGFFASKIAFAAGEGRRKDITVMDWDGYGAAGDHPRRAEHPAHLVALGRRDRVHLVHQRQARPVHRAVDRRTAAPALGAARAQHGRGLVARRQQDRGDAVAGRQQRDLPLVDDGTDHQAADQRSRHRHLAVVVARRLAHRVRLRSLRQPADLAHGRPTARGSSGSPASGNYNQEPTWCPRTDTPQIAFSARDEKLATDIFTINPDTEQYTRVTEGHGSSVRPTWAPNGRAIGFERASGIWVSTADGRTERQVYRGSAKAPQWSPSFMKK